MRRLIICFLMALATSNVLFAAGRKKSTGTSSLGLFQINASVGGSTWTRTLDGRSDKNGKHAGIDYNAGIAIGTDFILGLEYNYHHAPYKDAGVLSRTDFKYVALIFGYVANFSEHLVGSCSCGFGKVNSFIGVEGSELNQQDGNGWHLEVGADYKFLEFLSTGVNVRYYAANCGVGDDQGNFELMNRRIGANVSLKVYF